MKTFGEYLNERKKVEGPLPQIYVDLDQVMADFLRAAREELGHEFLDRSTRSKNEIWKILDAKKDFWEQLKPMKDAMVLWKFIKKHDPHILSAIPLNPQAVVDKKKWVKKHLGLFDQKRINLVKRNQKKDFAKANGNPAILIDDHIKNIHEWEGAGGIGIHHISAQKTISQLKKLGY